MNNHRDPLTVLRETSDPRVAAWAMRELETAGFRDVVGIARDFGWVACP